MALFKNNCKCPNSIIKLPKKGNWNDTIWTSFLPNSRNDWEKNTICTIGQLISEWSYEFIISPKMQTKNCKDFCPTIQTRIVALFWWFFGERRQFFWLRSLFVWKGRKILVIFGLHFGRNDDHINSKFILNLIDF